MSYDLFFQDWRGYKKLEDIPDGFKPKPIGNKTDIIKKIIEIIPDINFENKDWGILERDDFNIEFNMGDEDEEQIYSFALHIRGNDGFKPLIIQLINHLNIKASDGMTIFGT